MGRGKPTAGGRPQGPPRGRADPAAEGFKALERGRPDEAEACFRQAVAEAPSRPEGPIGLGRVAEARGDADAALRHYSTVHARWPGRPEGHVGLARMHLARGEVTEALPHLRWVADFRPDNPDAQAALGSACRALGDLEPAVACFDRALALDPGHPKATAEKALILEMRGDHDAAWDLVAPHLRGDATDPLVAHVYAKLGRRKGQADAAIRLLEGLLAGRPLAPDIRAVLEHQLGDSYAAAGDPDRAFLHHRAGNDAIHRGFDTGANRGAVDRLIAAFDAAPMARLPRASNLSRLPVFIVGMPRSGTTLVEQIIASHPAAAGAGERMEIGRIALTLPRTLRVRTPYPECVAELDRTPLDRLAEDHLADLRARFPDALRVTDKMPQNFRHLGLIARLFPAARVVHCVRDPRDTCLSCYTTNLDTAGHGYATDLAALGHYYREYERLMAHWKSVLDVPILDFRYEDVVADQEGKSRELIEFVGLEWDDRCLRFHETRRDVATASHAQVRRPMYASSVGRWKSYAKHLGPLLEALGDGG